MQALNVFWFDQLFLHEAAELTRLSDLISSRGIKMLRLPNAQKYRLNCIKMIVLRKKIAKVG